MKNILITGGAGFIGSYLVKLLLDSKKFNIYIITRNTTDLYRIKKYLNEITIVNVDKINEIFKSVKFDGVVHVATHFVKTNTLSDIDNIVDSNIKFPLKLLELSNENNVGFFINTGTFSEYSFNYNPINEKSKLDPLNLYSASKTSFDALLKYYSTISNMNIITLKLGAPYGYNDNDPKLFTFLMKNILNNTEVMLEKGEQEWDFIYVKDIASAYFSAISLCIETKRYIYEEVLVGTSKKTSVREIANIINKIHGKDIIKCEKNYSSKQVFLTYIDNSKARNLLQWTPQYTIEEAIEEIYNLYKENGFYKKDDY